MNQIIIEGPRTLQQDGINFYENLVKDGSGSILPVLHTNLWGFRRENERYWPTPNRIDALRFAICESAEALDQYLRLNATYKRNRVVVPDEAELFNELADCAMMLLTALGPHIFEWRYYDLGYPNIDTICIATPKALALVLHCEMHGDFWMAERFMQSVIMMISKYNGMNLRTRLAGRLERIRAKHCTPAEGTPDVS